MAENYLLDHPWFLVAAAFALTLGNVLLVEVGRRVLMSQSHIRTEAVDSSRRAAIGRTIPPLLFAAVVLAVALMLDREGLGVLAGGLLVTQLVAILLSASSVLAFRSLGRPGAAEGQLTYSVPYRYQVQAAQMLAGALVVWCAYLLRGGPMLCGGGIFLLAGAVGFYQRAGRARRQGKKVVTSDAA